MAADACAPAELARHLVGTVLDGRVIEQTAVRGTGAVIPWIRCRGDEVPAAWEAARAVVDVTGRWPVALWEVNAFPELISPTYGSAAPDPYETIARSRSIGGDAAALYFRTRKPARQIDLDDDIGARTVANELAATAGVAGQAPDLAAVVDALGRRFTDVDLQRWLDVWERPRRGPGSVEYLDWFVDEFSDHAIAFTPVADGPLASAFFSFWGADDPGEPERLVALLRRWEEAWGAELVASYGTMLQFVVRRPPTDGAAAWELALDHVAVAECTTVLAGISTRRHAHELIGRRRWFLHERP